MLNLLTGRIDRIRETPLIIPVVLLSAMGLWVGWQLWWDDALTSQLGIESLNNLMNIQSVILDNGEPNPTSFLALSIANQIFSVLLVFVYMTIYRDGRLMLLASVMEVIDTFSDVWYKTGDGLLIRAAVDNPTASAVGSVLVAVGVTVLYFSVGANLFLVVSITVLFDTVRDGIEQSAQFVADILSGLIMFVFKVFDEVGSVIGSRMEDEDDGATQRAQPMNRPRPTNRPRR